MRQEKILINFIFINIALRRIAADSVIKAGVRPLLHVPLWYGRRDLNSRQAD